MMKGMATLVSSLVWGCLVAIIILLGFTVFKTKATGDVFKPTSSTPGACLEQVVNPEWRPFGGPLPYYTYTTRKKGSNGKWTCPEGYYDTGCSSRYGASVANLQCRKPVSVTPGIWMSPVYGGSGGKGMTEYRCGPGEIVSHVVGFYGQNNNSNTNAFTAFCKRLGDEKIRPIMDKTTCGKRDYPNASQIAKDFLLSLTSLLIIDPFHIYKGAWGRKLYNHTFASTERGFNSWGVNVKGGEIHGLRLRSMDQTEMTAGGGDRNAQYTTYTGECPPGKAVIGFRASCGDRVDRIQMICDSDKHDNTRSINRYN